MGGCCTDGDAQPDPICVLVDVLVAMLAQPSQLLRTVVQQAFEALCPQMTEASLDILVQVLRSSSDGADGMDASDDGDDDDDEDAAADAEAAKAAAASSRRSQPARPNAAAVADARAAAAVRTEDPRSLPSQGALALVCSRAFPSLP